ncbi:hypothetical protein C8F04DRAFT_1115463 [Mycena alexandri]|uniref:Uncharacterized protein n=1 Tax=Mycena alexandri TaxID=1745969 RepID=A0AAD6SMZ8_9AGAR|nr:hypothetical protein C8F04DRAFT_1115463 [Mycena alexandri]
MASDSSAPFAIQGSTAVGSQSSQQFLPNATGFEIVGGQFVLGDVHNHAVTNPPYTALGTSLSTFDNSHEDFSESEIYCSQLRRQKRGRPLYGPAPQTNLSAAFRRRGVAIGDVGRVTPEGTFDFFFNIFLPSEHPINGNRTPEDFSPLPLYESVDVSHFDYSPGSHISTVTVEKVDLDPPSNVFPAGDFTFSCAAPRGAVLALPHGARLEKLDNLENMRAYAARHADSWYKYVNGTRGRGLANGDLCLVTGCEKTRSWGMASYHTGREEFELTFKRTVRPETTYKPYHWSGAHGQRNPARRKSYDPASTNAPMNQTTFLHGFSISLPTGLWGKLFGAVETTSIVDFQCPSNASATGGFPQNSSQRFSFSWFGTTGETGGTRRAGDHGEVVLSDLSPIAKLFDPAKLINAYILHKVPHATVVMSHDDDWADILGDNSEITGASDFLQRIDDKFTIAEKDGATFLVPKFPSSDNILAVSSLKSPAETLLLPPNTLHTGFARLQLNPESESAWTFGNTWDQLSPEENQRDDHLARVKEEYARANQNYEDRPASQSTSGVLLEPTDAPSYIFRRIRARLYRLRPWKYSTSPFTLLWGTVALSIILRTLFSLFGSLPPRNSTVNDWQQECAALFDCTSPGLVDINGQPISCNSTIQSAPEVWGITYGACQTNCGMDVMRQGMNYSTAAIPLTSSVLPWLALIAQLPFEASDVWTNVVSVLLCVGSPALATYSLALTMSNRWYITGRFQVLKRTVERETGSKYQYLAGRVDDAAFILREGQQYPIGASQPNGELAQHLLILNGRRRENFWEIAALDLKNARRGISFSTHVVVLWALLAYSFSFLHSLVGPDVDHQFASSIVWSWMFPIIYGYSRLGSRYKIGSIEAALSENSIPAKRLPATWGFDIRGDERKEGPIYNYARFLPWFHAIAQVENEFPAAIASSRGQRVPRTTMEAAECFGWEPCPDLSASRAQFHLPGGAIMQMWKAALMALFLQWGTTGVAAFVAYSTPSVGFGCRSGGYLIYGLAATVSWLMLILSNLLSHAVMQRAVRDPDARIGSIGWVAVGTRLGGKILGICNAIWLVASSVMGNMGVFQSCWCQTDSLQYGQSGWAPVFKGQQDLRNVTQNIWIGGFIWSVAVCLIAGAFFRTCR